MENGKNSNPPYLDLNVTEENGKSAKSRTVHWDSGNIMNRSANRNADCNNVQSRKAYFGPDVLIIIGIVLFLIGLGLTLYGINTTFNLLELEITVMGIGPSLIAISIVFLLLRLFYCKPFFLHYFRNKRFNSTTNTIHPTDINKPPLYPPESERTAQDTGTVAVSYSYSVSSETTVKVEPSEEKIQRSEVVDNLSDKKSLSSHDYVMDELQYLSPSSVEKEKNRDTNNAEYENEHLEQKTNGVNSSSFNQAVHEMGLELQDGSRDKL